MCLSAYLLTCLPTHILVSYEYIVHTFVGFHSQNYAVHFVLLNTRRTLIIIRQKPEEEEEQEAKNEQTYSPLLKCEEFHDSKFPVEDLNFKRRQMAKVANVNMLKMP